MAISKVILYEKMSRDKQFQPFLAAQRDWLFGRNPWGTSMFTGLPAEGEFPKDVHTGVYVMLGLSVPDWWMGLFTGAFTITCWALR